MQVFDGHSGEQCSEFVAKTLHMDLIKALKAEKGPLDEENVKKCIVAAVAKTDKEFLRIAKIRCVGPRAEWDRDLVGKRNADPLLRPPLQEITVKELTDDHSLVLLGCDGIWDVLSDQVRGCSTRVQY